MTMAQIQLYSREVCLFRREAFKSDVISQLYGSRASPEEIEQALDKE